MFVGSSPVVGSTLSVESARDLPPLPLPLPPLVRAHSPINKYILKKTKPKFYLYRTGSERKRGAVVHLCFVKKEFYSSSLQPLHFLPLSQNLYPTTSK